MSLFSSEVMRARSTVVRNDFRDLAALLNAQLCRSDSRSLHARAVRARSKDSERAAVAQLAEHRNFESGGCGFTLRKHGATVKITSGGETTEVIP